MLLMLSAGLYILEPHELEVDELLQINYGCLAMPQSILGLWSSESTYRTGQYSDEGYSSGEAT